MNSITLLLLLTLASTQTLAGRRRRPKRESNLLFTPDLKDHVVNVHNEYRSLVLPPASAMNKLVWDERLELYALEWASCGRRKYFKHRHTKYLPFGELLSISGSTVNVFSDGLAEAIESSVDVWWKERDYYLYDRNRCKIGKQCESYIQLAWAKTTSVGCAYAMNCRNKAIRKRKWKYNFYLVCYYNPAANIGQGRPYMRLPNSNVRTRGGTSKRKNCLFPFQYNGTKYTSCIRSTDADSPWCRVEDGNWGYCIAQDDDCTDKDVRCYINSLIYYGGRCPAESALTAKDDKMKYGCRRFCKYCSCKVQCQNGGRETYNCGCLCRNSWAGADCNFCPITSCKNGGTFDAANCKCNCVAGHGGAECSCKDNPEKWLIRPGKYWSCKWKWIKKNGLCTCPYYKKALSENCPGLCNVCVKPLDIYRKY